MQDSQILSTFQELPVAQPAPRPARVLIFDACQTGVILRAVLFVEGVMGVGAMFGAVNFMDWLARLAMLTGGALPATLAWLIAACSAKKLLARLPNQAQYACGVLLGVLAGLYGCGLLALVGYVGSVPWVASAFAGAVLASALVAALVWRAKARTPADTAARLTELQARIRPHFLFNTLNSAIALVREDPARAEALLEDLSDLFRHALMDQGESVTLAQEITLAERYLAIEQVRLGGIEVEADAAQRHRRADPHQHAAPGRQRGGQGHQHGAGRPGPSGPRAGAGQRARPPAPAARCAVAVPDRAERRCVPGAH